MNSIQKILLAGALLASLLFFISPEIQAQQKANYTVKQGDTLYGISKKLDVTIAELKRWNNLSGNEIGLGQKLVYYESDQPEDVQAQPTPSEPLVGTSDGPENQYYLVKSGDTLYGIAREHNMTVSQLRELNNISGSAINVGQKLVVRKKTRTAPSIGQFTEASSPQGVFSTYKVQRRETKNALLKKFRMSDEEFNQLNPQLNIERLTTGQEITVLLPPSKNYGNPYLQKADLQNLGQVPTTRYNESEAGEATTNGELHNPDDLTAAHSNIAMGSIIFIENTETGAGIYVRINDRITGSGLKLSQKAYFTLGLNDSNQPAVTIYTEEI